MEETKAETMLEINCEEDARKYLEAVLLTQTRISHSRSMPKLKREPETGLEIMIVRALLYPDPLQWAELQREFKKSPESVQNFVRSAVVKCLEELKEPASQWYQVKGGDLPADNLLLFTNDNDGVVVTGNRAKILALLEAIPTDIDEKIKHPVPAEGMHAKNIHERRIGVISSLLTADEPSMKFIKTHKEKYSQTFWTQRKDIYGMEKFHGVEAAYELACQQNLDTGFLFQLALYVNTSHRRSDWINLLAQKRMAKELGPLEKAEKAILVAIEQGLAEKIDWAKVQK